MTEELPDPRADGKCAVCVKKDAVTTDRRFCQKCLTALVNRLNPVPLGGWRPGGKRQAAETDPSPWGENAVRALEGD